MKAFVCAGLAVILGLIIFAWNAETCLTCCDGQPCNPELNPAPAALGDKL